MHAWPRGDQPEPTVILGNTYNDEPWYGWSIGSTHIDRGWLTLPGIRVSGFDGYDAADQPVLVEVWVEKSTMDDVLAPVCARLSVNLLSDSGFQSITAAIALLRRAQAHRKPAHVILRVGLVDHALRGAQPAAAGLPAGGHLIRSRRFLAPHAQDRVNSPYTRFRSYGPRSPALGPPNAVGL